MCRMKWNIELCGNRNHVRKYVALWNMIFWWQIFFESQRMKRKNNDGQAKAARKGSIVFGLEGEDRICWTVCRLGSYEDLVTRREVAILMLLCLFCPGKLIINIQPTYDVQTTLPILRTLPTPKISCNRFWYYDLTFWRLETLWNAFGNCTPVVFRMRVLARCCAWCCDTKKLCFTREMNPNWLIGFEEGRGSSCYQKVEIFLSLRLQ